LPVSKSRRLFISSTLGTDTRQRAQLELDINSLATSSSLYSSSNNSGRRSWSSSAFFSTAPSPDFLEDEEYYDENSRDNRSFTTSSRARRIRESTTNTRSNAAYGQSTIDRIVSGGIGEYQSVDVDSVVTEDYLQRLVDDHISHNNSPPNPNMLLNMLELLHNEETHISSETVLKIFREVVRSKRVKLLERAEDVVVKNLYDPRLLRLLVTGYLNAGAPRRACKLLMEWPNESIQHQPGIESYRRVLTALGPSLSYDDNYQNNDKKQQTRTRSKTQYNRPRHAQQDRDNRNKGRNANANANTNTNTNSVDKNDQSDVQKNYRLAHRLLQHMCRTHLKFPELALAPDRDCFHRVLATCSYIDSLSTAKEILEEMTRFAASRVGREVNNATATSPIEGNNTETSASLDTQPNVSTIRLLVKVWATVSEGDTKTIEMQKEAFEFLRRIEAETLSSTLSSNIVDINCYNVLLNKLAELGQYELTETMFRRLLTDFVKGEKSNVQPDMVTLNTVLKSHVQAHTEAAAVSAERFLECLDDFYEQQERIRKNKPVVINADDDDGDDDTPRVVYDIQPTARARSIISNLWVKLGQPHRAVQILTKAESVYHEKEQQLLQLQQQDVKTAHNYSIDTIKRFRPDKISYRQIIGGLCKLKYPPTSDLATEAGEIAERLCKMGHRLNLLTCNTILNCWTKSGNPDRAEIYLEETMREYDVVPDTVSYNTIIHGHAQLGNLDRALELLTRLLEDSLSNSNATDKSEQRRSVYPKPNVRTFTNILIALSKSNTIKAAEEAEILLLRMQELNEPPYNLDTRPNTITYNAIMNCWASLSLPSSRRKRKLKAPKTNGNSGSERNQIDNNNDNDHHRFGRKAEFVLRSMQGLGINERPDAVSYNTVIRAYSNDMVKAEELVGDMIANGLEPTDHTYKTLIHVLNRDFRIKDKDKKLEELRELYFASSPFAQKNGRSLNNNRNASQVGHKKKNGDIAIKNSRESPRRSSIQKSSRDSF